MNNEMIAMLEWVITACIKTQLLKLSGQKDKNHEKSVRAAVCGLGLPYMQVILLLWQPFESNMHVTGRFFELHWNNINMNTIFKLKVFKSFIQVHYIMKLKEKHLLL
jgi:hypothetical protein